MKKSQNKLTFSNVKVQKYIFIWTFLSIAVVNFLVFYLYVNINSFVLAFTDLTGHFSVEWFSQVFRSVTQGGATLNVALINTSIYFAYGVIVFPIGVFHAYFFYKKMRGSNFFRVMFHLPMIISSVVMTTTFKYMINPDGPLGILYMDLFNLDRVPSFLTEAEYAKWTMIFYSFWFGFAGSLLLWGGAMARIPQEVIESVNLDGINWLKELWYIVLPMIWPTLSITIMTMFAGFFSTDVGVLLLSEGAGNSGNVSYWMFAQIKYYNSYNLASAFGLCLSVVAVPITFIVRKICGMVYADVEF